MSLGKSQEYLTQCILEEFYGEPYCAHVEAWHDRNARITSDACVLIKRDQERGPSSGWESFGGRGGFDSGNVHLNPNYVYARWLTERHDK